MMTFYDLLRTKCEDLWLNDKNAVPGLSNVNPLRQPKPKAPKPMPKLKPVRVAQESYLTKGNKMVISPFHTSRILGSTFPP